MELYDQTLFRELHALVVREFEATSTPAGHARLESLLRDNRAARRLYLDYMQETACLRWLCLEEFQRGDDGAADAAQLASMPSSPINRRLVRRTAVVFAALACSLLLATWLVRASREIDDRETAAGAAKDASAVATITALDSARWADARGRLLARCRVGERWQLEEGRAQLTFDSGALVTLFAPADFDIVSPTAIRCRRGRVTALVDERGKGFTIETPQAKVIDLGTQFGLNISDDGETQVVVFDGSVDLSYGAESPTADGGQIRRLEQGDALSLTSSGKLERIMAVRRDQFLAAARGTNRPFVIDNVRDNIRSDESVKSYQIVHGGLDEDSLCFVDRDHEWNGVDETGLPDFLRGADYIMPFNDDKFVENLELVVQLSRPATLYIFLDNNMEVPDWLRNEFKDTGVDVGLDGATTEWHPENSLAEGAAESIDFTFSVWQRQINEPGEVKMGGVKPPERRSRGFNMYGIAAVARE